MVFRLLSVLCLVVMCATGGFVRAGVACDAAHEDLVSGQWGMAGGVTVYLRDGREFTGRLIEELPHRITIEVVISGIKVDMTFGADEVRSMERYDEELPPARPAHTPVRPERSDVSPGEGGWVVVPAHGTIGVELTRNFFETSMSKAVNSGAEVIIFDLRSPGGYLYSLEEIYEALQAQRDRIKVVFFVDDACFSAAALLCITSDSFFVGPGASFGSAVVIQGNHGGGVDAVNAKYASAQAAIWRARAERRGRPGILVNAMMLVETEVWADKATTPWKLFASRPVSVGDAAELVVGDRAILSMTATEAVGLGAADARREDVRELVRELKLRNPDREAFNGASHATTVIRNQQRRMHDLESRLNFIDSVLVRIRDGIKDETITIEQFRRDLIRVRSGLDRIRREMEQTDYIRFQCLLRGVSYEVIDEWKKVIDDALRETR